MTTASYTSEFYNYIGLVGLQESLLANSTYVYLADGSSSITTPAEGNNSVKSQMTTLRSVICGKLVQPEDIYLMITRNNWTSNTIYAMYDDQDGDLQNKNFYVLNSARAVYKCLFNSDGIPSTSEPTSLDPLAVKLADGYVWQFMYRLTVNELSTRGTTELIPVIANANVVSNAVGGSIETYVVTNSGDAYSATNSGTVTSIVSNTVFQIENGASAVDGIYNTSAMYISSGPGVGQISVISSYFSNASGRFVTTADSLINVTISSTYDIAPAVVITGDGSNATARVVMDVDNVDSIEVIENGQFYTYADITIQANSAYGSGAQARAIVSPLNGHGFDPAVEMFARKLSISVVFIGDEANTIPNTFSFSQYGLIRDVRQAANTALEATANTFDNTVELVMTPISGQFDRGDYVEAAGDANTAAIVVNATSNTAVLTYVNTEHFDAFDDLVTNDDTGIASIDSIVHQPNINLYQADILSITNINTLDHTANTQETVNIFLRV